MRRPNVYQRSAPRSRRVDVPAGRLAEFVRVWDPLIGKSMVAKGEVLPREFGAAEARAAAQDIVSLLAAEMTNP